MACGRTELFGGDGRTHGEDDVEAPADTGGDLPDDDTPSGPARTVETSFETPVLLRELAQPGIDCEAGGLVRDGEALFVLGICGGATAQLWRRTPDGTVSTIDSFSPDSIAYAARSSMYRTSTGGLFILTNGEHVGGTNGGHYRGVIRHSVDGATAFVTRQTFAYDTTVTGIVEASDGTLVLSGSYRGTEGSREVIQRLSANGVPQQTIPSDGLGWAGDVNVLADGAIAVPLFTSGTHGLRFATSDGATWTTIVPVTPRTTAANETLSVFSRPGEPHVYVAGAWRGSDTWVVLRSVDRTSWEEVDALSGVVATRPVHHRVGMSIIVGAQAGATGPGSTPLVRASLDGVSWSVLADAASLPAGTRSVRDAVVMENGDVILLTTVASGGTPSILHLLRLAFRDSAEL